MTKLIKPPPTPRWINIEDANLTNGKEYVFHGFVNQGTIHETSYVFFGKYMGESGFEDMTGIWIPEHEISHVLIFANR